METQQGPRAPWGPRGAPENLPSLFREGSVGPSCVHLDAALAPWRGVPQAAERLALASSPPLKPSHGACSLRVSECCGSDDLTETDLMSPPASD